MGQNNTSDNFNNTPTQHVYKAAKSSIIGSIIGAILLFGGAALLGAVALAICKNSKPDFAYLRYIFPVVTVVLGLLFNFLLYRSNKKDPRLLVINENGVRFILNNGKEKNYTYDEFQKMSITRHYQNGAYTHSTHDLVFRKAPKNKLIYESLSSFSDSVTELYNDITHMKDHGSFSSLTDETSVDGNTGEPAAAIDRLSLTSTIDGRIYQHTAEELFKKQRRSNIIGNVILLGLAGSFLAYLGVEASKGLVNSSNIAALLLIPFVLIIVDFIVVLVNLSNRKRTKKTMKEFRFYQNGLLVTTMNGQQFYELANIRSILLPPANDHSSQLHRNVTIVTEAGRHAIDVGLISSPNKLAVFQNYASFYNDMHIWCAEHRVSCMEDVSR